MSCEICGKKGSLQKHHISYDPEITQNICTPCHYSIHKHGVGRPAGYGKNHAVVATRVRPNMKKMISFFIENGEYKTKSEFIRDAIEEMIQRDAPHLIRIEE